MSFPSFRPVAVVVCIMVPANESSGCEHHFNWIRVFSSWMTRFLWSQIIYRVVKITCKKAACTLLTSVLLKSVLTLIFSGTNLNPTRQPLPRDQLEICEIWFHSPLGRIPQCLRFIMTGRLSWIFFSNEGKDFHLQFTFQMLDYTTLGVSLTLASFGSLCLLARWSR